LIIKKIKMHFLLNIRKLKLSTQDQWNPLKKKGLRYKRRPLKFCLLT